MKVLNHHKNSTEKSSAALGLYSPRVRRLLKATLPPLSPSYSGGCPGLEALPSHEGERALSNTFTVPFRPVSSHSDRCVTLENELYKTLICRPLFHLESTT